MSANNTTVEEYTCVRFYFSTASFSLLLFFNLVINWTIVRVEHLRSHARFVLIFHLLLSALVYMGTSSIFYYQIHQDARLSSSACRAMITVLISSACNILLTLTAMALDRYCAVCHPMRYTSTCVAAYWPWLLGILTWVVALIIPLSIPHSDQEERLYDGHCGREQQRKGEPQRIIFIATCSLIILYSYVRIFIEGRRLGVLNRRNRTGCRTITLHGSQLAAYLLPNFVSFVLSLLFKKELIRAETKELSNVVVFAFFSLAQCVAPVVYGLRKEELLEQMGRRFPCCARYFKSVLGWTVQVNWKNPRQKPRERTLTAQTILSLEVSQVPSNEESRRMSGVPHETDSDQSDSENA